MPDYARGICALKQVQSRDFAIPNQRKRFSEWKIVCNHLQMLLRNNGYAVTSGMTATIAQVQEQFQLAWDLHNTNVKFLHPHRTKRLRMRTRPQALSALKVSSVARDIRAVQKNVVRMRFAMFIKYLQNRVKEARRQAALAARE